MAAVTVQSIQNQNQTRIRLAEQRDRTAYREYGNPPRTKPSRALRRARRTAWVVRPCSRSALVWGVLIEMRVLMLTSEDEDIALV